MSYFFDSRVRYSEVGENERLTLNSILNYFQDSSTFHSEDVGRGISYLAQSKRIWLLSSWQIVINRYPALGEKIRTKTWPYAFKRFLGSRNFIMEDEKGEVTAYANSLWAFMNLETNAPAMITEHVIDRYTLEEKLDMEYAPRKIMIPEGCEKLERFLVKSHHLDTNHHVNNGQYVQMAMEYIPSDFIIHQMRAEYKKQAVLGDLIIPKIHYGKKQYTVALCGPDDEPYVVVELASL